MILLSILIYVVLGTVSGILAGLLGIGGGIIIVPCLFFIFKYLLIHIQMPMHLAIGSSLAIITIASLMSVYLYQKRHAIFWPTFKNLTIGLILGSILGVIFAYFIPGQLLTKIFGIFAFIIGLYLLFAKKIYQTKTKPAQLYSNIFGGIIGILATLLGIGGGVVAMPFFIMSFRVPKYCLIGNASVSTFITSIVGMLCYIFAGFISSSNNILSLGYIYLPAFIIVGTTSIFSVYFGVKLADRLDVHILKKIFAIALIGTSIIMMI